MKFDKLEKLLNEYHCLEDGIAVACGGTGGTKDVDAMSERLDELLAIPEVAERIQTEREEVQKRAKAGRLAGDLIFACVDLNVEKVRKSVSEGADVNVASSSWDLRGYTPLHIVYYILDKYKLVDNADAVKKAKDIIRILLGAGADCAIEIQGKPIIEHYRSMPIIFSVFKEAYEQDKKALETFSTAGIDRIGSESPVKAIAGDRFLLRSIAELTMRIPGPFFSSPASAPSASAPPAGASHDDEGSSKKTCVIS